MTFREKLKKVHPEFVQEDLMGGCEGCPGYYWRDAPEFSGECKLGEGVGFNCWDCWDTEAPENQAPIEMEER